MKACWIIVTEIGYPSTVFPDDSGPPELLSVRPFEPSRTTLHSVNLPFQCILSSSHCEKLLDTESYMIIRSPVKFCPSDVYI